MAARRRRSWEAWGESSPGPAAGFTEAGDQSAGAAESAGGGGVDERRIQRSARRSGGRGADRAERAADRAAQRAAQVAADPAGVAREVVLRQLTMGARSRAQLQQAILRKGVPEDVAAVVLDRFEEVDLVDDAEFARQWVQTRHLGRGLARRALAHELRQRGVADETVKGAVDELSTDDELSAARELVRRKAMTMRSAEPQQRIRRLAGMLARKGYSGAVAIQAIRTELAAAEFDSDDGLGAVEAADDAEPTEPDELAHD